MTTYSRLECADEPEVIVLDNENVSLWVRVGPVFNADEIDDKPGIWVNYQSDYMNSTLEGPVLIDTDTWDALDKIVRERIAAFDKDNYGGNDARK